MSTGRDSDKKEQIGSFLSNGFEHFPINQKKAITLGFVLFVLWIATRSISGYKFAIAEIDQRINDNTKIIKMEGNIETMQKQISEINTNVNGWLKSFVEEKDPPKKVRQ